MIGSRPAAALVFAACQPPLVSYPERDPAIDTATPQAPFALERVLPAYGTAGHRVRVDGGPFGPDTVVRFADLEARIVDLDEDAVTVEVPALAPGVVEIDVASGGETAPSLPFRYFEDAAGRVGALGVVEWHAYRGDYWSSGTVDRGYAFLAFPLPTDIHWATLNYASAPDRCERQYSPGVTTVHNPELPEVTLTWGPDPSDRIVVPADPEEPHLFRAYGLEVQTGVAYDLAPMTGNPEWPDFEVPELSGEVPTDFVVTDPPIDAPSPPPVEPGFTLAWAGPYDGDSVLVLVQRVQAGQIQETATCWLEDDGAHTMPVDLFQEWDPVLDSIYLRIGRARRPAGTVLPHNGGRSEVLGVFWSIGYLDPQ